MKKAETIASWIKEFEADYFTRRARTPKSETTWRTDYLRVFHRLPQDEALTPEILKSLAISTSPDTRTRKRFCIALGALARFSGLEINLKPYSGSYCFNSACRRNLPDDIEIVAGFEQVKDQSWRWVYGMIAAYGLRPHEVFYLDYQRIKIGNPALRVLGGKTGERLVFPFYPEWLEQFDLRTVVLPRVSGATNGDLGHRVAQAFRRVKLPFGAYDLRHCWAVRTLEFGLELPLAARQMGHSTKVHTEIYHAWISEKVQHRAFEALMAKPNRPQAPKR